MSRHIGSHFVSSHAPAGEEPNMSDANWKEVTQMNAVVSFDLSTFTGKFLDSPVRSAGAGIVIFVGRTFSKRR